MGFGSEEQGREPVLEQQCLPGSQVHTAPVMGSQTRPSARKEKAANSGKQLGRAAESAFSQSREVKPVKNMGGSEWKEQVVQGRLWAIAEGSPAGGTLVGGADRKDGQEGQTDSGHKGAPATLSALGTVSSPLPEPGAQTCPGKRAPRKHPARRGSL